MQTLIFANGQYTHLAGVNEIATHAALIIAANGGANSCLRENICPDVLIGDLDSIHRENLQQLQAMGKEIHTYAPEKDATDLELALDLAKIRGATTITILGALGGRWDMSLANILLAAAEKYKKIAITIIDTDCRIDILQPGKSHVIMANKGDTFSLLAVKQQVQGLSLSGCKYPLTDHTLDFGSSHGISNIFLSEQTYVNFTSGVLLAIIPHG